MADVVTLDCLANWLRRWCARPPGDEQINYVSATLIDDYGYWFTIDIVEPAAKQRKSLGGQIDDRGRDVYSAIEPRLHGMLVAGCYIHQMAGLKRTDVRRNNLAGNC